MCYCGSSVFFFFFFFQAEDGIRDTSVTGVQTCALPIYPRFQSGVSGRPLKRGVRRRSMPLRTSHLGAMLVFATLLVAAGTPVVYAAHVHPTVLYAVLAYLGWGVVAVQIGRAHV